MPREVVGEGGGAVPNTSTNSGEENKKRGGTWRPN